MKQIYKTLQSIVDVTGVWLLRDTHFLKFRGYGKAYGSASTKHDKTSTGVYCRDQQKKSCKKYRIHQSMMRHTSCVQPSKKISRDAVFFICLLVFREGRSHLLAFFLAEDLPFAFLFLNWRLKLLTQLHDLKLLEFQEKSQISHHWQKAHRSVFSWRHLWFLWWDLWHTQVWIYPRVAAAIVVRLGWLYPCYLGMLSRSWSVSVCL